MERYLTHRPGVIGIVLRDRSTGAAWRNKAADSQIYMASTSKLAMEVTLLLQDEAGVIRLSSAADVAIEWVEGDAEDLPFDDRRFDVILSIGRRPRAR